MMNRKPKILLSAFACIPGRGSEPGVGWNTARSLSALCPVTVLAPRRPWPDMDQKPLVDDFLAKNPNHDLTMIYVDLPEWLGRIRLKFRYFVTFYYWIWQLKAWWVARRLRGEVDLVHHVTFVNYWRPIYMPLLGLPFLWGPVGGGESTPSPFRKQFSLRGRIHEAVRDFIRWLGEHDPMVRLTARRSSLALATTKDTAARLTVLGAKKVEVTGESGLSLEEVELLASMPDPELQPVRFLSLGNLIHLKGFNLGLSAFARMNEPGAEYWLVGDGAERAALEAQARDLGVADRVRFFGKLPREKALQRLGQCHVLVHPSLHDSGGWVCLEAMAAGRPVICLDLGGPATQVTGATGFRVAALDIEQAVTDLATAMDRLAGDENLRHAMGKAGQELIRAEYLWERKAEVHLSRYLGLLGR